MTVLDCQGSILAVKYAEGCPGKRHYGDCAWVGACEQLAIDRAKALFGGDHVYEVVTDGVEHEPALIVETTMVAAR
ncbi:MAG: hypothetical protein WBC33_04620 [Conexibacter sp.]